MVLGINTLAQLKYSCQHMCKKISEELDQDGQQRRGKEKGEIGGGIILAYSVKPS